MDAPRWREPAADHNGPMTEAEILQQIHDLVAEEHTLRQQVQDGELDPDQEQRKLTRLEQTLDQCWDLLRQWRAHREFGEVDREVAVRPVSEVEGYTG